ncbi:MAG: hypothetical protein V4669_05645 [Pseudomonadota bacterium]
MTAPTFTHLINPVFKPPGHELSVAQPVTFASMDRARQHFAQETGGHVRVICAIYDEDEPLVPPFAEGVIRLRKSFRDVVASGEAPKLPLVQELLDGAGPIASGEYIVFSNIDIALMPNFYTAAAAYLASGYDNLVINRRTILPAPSQLNNLDLLYSLAGNPHPGYDCFVFRIADLQRFAMGNLVVGLPGFDWIMALNLWYRGGRNLGLYDHHLTFHIGDDKSWMSDAMRHWQTLNYENMLAPLESLRSEFGDKEHFIWPRPQAHRGLVHRIMNKIARQLLGAWPNQA